MKKTDCILDAGHGGSDPGASGFGELEKDWTLKITLYQQKRLKELGLLVDVTRNRDVTVTPTSRTSKIRSQYRYCFSNHLNAFNGQARGVESIHSIYTQGGLAEKITRQIVKNTGVPYRRTFSKKNSRNQDWYYMHRDTGNTETVIIEYGFINNRGDHDLLLTKGKWVDGAEALIEVICELYNVDYKKPKPVVSKPKPVQGKWHRVQVGAFQDRKKAENLIKELERKGYKPILKID